MEEKKTNVKACLLYTSMPVHIFEKSALEKGLKEHQAKFDIPAEDLLSLIARYQVFVAAKTKTHVFNLRCLASNSRYVY